MRKILSCLFLIIFCMTTISFATTDNLLILTNDSEDEISEIPEILVDNLENSSETVYEKDDVFKSAEQVNLSGIVDSNAYIIGKEANLKDLTVYGNVYVMAETINFENVEIGGSVYAMAKDINFSGTASDIYFLAGKANFSSDSKILRNAKMGAGTVSLNGDFARNVLISCEELTVLDEASIQGKLTYYSQNEASISDKAQILEKEFVMQEETDAPVEVKKENVIVSYVMKILTVVMKTLIVALIIVFCICKFEKLNRTENIASDFAKNAGIGCLNLIFVPILSILFMITGVGVGLGIILLILYIISIYIAVSVSSIEIAKRILKTPTTDKNFKLKYIGLSVLVSVIISFISLIPVIGGIIKFVLVLVGLGILFNLIFQKAKIEEK